MAKRRRLIYKLSLGFSSSFLDYHVLTTFAIKLQRVIKLSSNFSESFSTSSFAPSLFVIIPVASLNLRNLSLSSQRILALVPYN